jgi:hypothetical protein
MNRTIPSVLAALALAGCAAGQRTAAPGDFISMRTNPLGLSPVQIEGSAIQVTPTLAVTAKHIPALLTGDRYEVPGMDIAYFAHDGVPVPGFADARLGETVTLDGNSFTGHTTSSGQVLLTDASRLDCSSGTVERGIAFDADASTGDSGGAVKNADGQLVAMFTGWIMLVPGTFARTGPAMTLRELCAQPAAEGGRRVAFAIPAHVIRAHLAEAEASRPAPMPWWGWALLVLL